MLAWSSGQDPLCDFLAVEGSEIVQHHHEVRPHRPGEGPGSGCSLEHVVTIEAINESSLSRAAGPGVPRTQQ